MTPRVLLQPKRARPFYGRHPWVYAGAIAAVEGDPADGDEVDLLAHGGNFIARGLFNAHSKIRVRLKVAFPHNAVIIFPTGTDWKKTGLVLDAWKRQKSDLDKMVYKFTDWYGTVDAGVKLIGEDE